MPTCDRMDKFQMVKASAGGGVERMRWRNLAGIKILLGQRLRNFTKKKKNPYSVYRNVKSSVAAVKSCEWSTGEEMFLPSQDSTERRVRACPLMMNYAVWYHSARVKVLSPSDFQAFCRKKKMLKLCKMASPAVADGAAVWEAFRHLCQEESLSCDFPMFPLLGISGKKKKAFGWEIVLSLNYLFFFWNTLCNVKEITQTSSSALKGACHYITSTDFWNLNAIVKVFCEMDEWCWETFSFLARIRPFICAFWGYLVVGAAQ